MPTALSVTLVSATLSVPNEEKERQRKKRKAGNELSLIAQKQYGLLCHEFTHSCFGVWSR